VAALDEQPRSLRLSQAAFFPSDWSCLPGGSSTRQGMPHRFPVGEIEQLLHLDHNQVSRQQQQQQQQGAIGGGTSPAEACFLPPGPSSGTASCATPSWDVAMPTDPWYCEAHRSLATLAAEVNLELDAGMQTTPPPPPRVSNRGGGSGVTALPSNPLEESLRNEWDAMLLSVLSLPQDTDQLLQVQEPGEEEAPPNSAATTDSGSTPDKSQTAGSLRSCRNSANSRGTGGSDPENAAQAREQRAIKKRIASRRRYADHKSKLDELKSTTQELLQSNKTLRSKLEEVQREIQQIEAQAQPVSQS